MTASAATRFLCHWLAKSQNVVLAALGLSPFLKSSRSWLRTLQASDLVPRTLRWAFRRLPVSGSVPKDTATRQCLGL